MSYSREQLREMGFDEEQIEDAFSEDPEPTPERSAPETDGEEDDDLSPSTLANMAGRSFVFHIPGRPHGKQRPIFDKSKGRVVKRPKTRQYEEKIEWIVEDMKDPAWPMDATYRLEVLAVYPDGNVADISNVVKAVEDGLNGQLWDDDRQVREIDGERRIDRDCDGYVSVQVEILEDP